MNVRLILITKLTVFLNLLIPFHLTASINKPFFENDFVAQKLQEEEISGRVLDKDGHGISGVSVTVKGSAIATATDVNGVFKLQIKNRPTVLLFSSIGYQSVELNVSGQRTLEVILNSNAADLDEVVVVGMNFKQTKRSVTGAMATIQTKELKQSPVANLNNALAGRLPGLITVQSSGKPGEDAAAMYIRGIATYGSNTAPLIVIDGLPRGQGSFSQIDPNEVESVSILKDASSSALYGIQGANGVIVVTTKRGRANQKPSIDFTGQQAIQQVIRLPYPMSAYENALYANEYDINGGSQPRFNEEALTKLQDGSDPYLYPNVNWFDEVLKNNALQNQYNINISGSSDRVRYFVSGSSINQSSLLKHEDLFYENYGKKSGFQRYNFRSNVDVQATSRLQIQVDLAGRLEKRVGPMPSFEEVFSQISNVSPYSLPVFNPDGSLGAGSAVVTPYWRNPYGLITQSGYYENNTNEMYGTLSARHDLDFLTKGLTVQGYFSFENNNINNTTRAQEFDAFWYRGLDIDGLPFYQQARIATTLTTGGSNTIVRSTYSDVRLNYTRKVADHEVTGQFLFNRTLRNSNYELPYAYQGISGRFTYGFKSKYFAELNLGYNGSENFPEGSRYGFFPSGSFAWIASDESFLKDVTWLKYLKIRGSFGEVGNDKIGGQRWLYLSDFASGGGYQFGLNPTGRPGFNESRVGNPYVTWERSQKMNAGFEISIGQGQLIQLVFDIFKERRSNILTAPGTVPDYYGIDVLAPLNSGIVSNSGLDGELKLNKKWNDLRVFANFQLTYSRNKVIENDQPNPMFSYQDLRGYPVGYRLGYLSNGFFDNQDDIERSAKQAFDTNIIPGDIKYLDINSDGVVDAFDRVPIQISNVPNFMGGVSFGASYKALDISLLLNGATGGTADYVPRFQDRIHLQRWTADNNEEAKMPVAKNSINNLLTSDFYTFSTNYLKLRNAEIGYELSSTWLEKIKLKSARVYLNGQNLLIWDKLWIKDRDPESSGSWNAPYPIQRVFNLGVNIRI